MKKILFLALAMFALSACSGGGSDDFFKDITGNGDDKGNDNKDDNGSLQYPSMNEAQAMLTKIVGDHTAGMLFVGDANNNIEKDSVGSLLCRVTANDSAYTVYDFPVSKFARYVKNESLKKSIENLPNQKIKGKLYPYLYASSLFCTQAENVTFKTEDGKDAALAFYGGLTNYSLAGYAQNRNFAIYLTPGGIYVDKKLQNDALYTSTSSYYGGSVPYICILQFPTKNNEL